MDPGINEVLDLQGVMAVAEFAPDGSVSEFKGELELLPPVQTLATRLAAKVNDTFDELARTYSSISDMTWTPRRCWIYSGGDWIVAVGHGRLVFARADDTDLDELHRHLSQM